MMNMKKIITIIAALLITANVWSQHPNMMSYQAVIRNSDDKLMTNTSVGMQISIIQSSTNGTAVYVERQFPTTNSNGLVSIEIGGSNATTVSGNISTIDWSNGPYFIKTETDLNGGSNYTISGTSQLLTVPYAMHAKTADQVNITGDETAFVGWDKDTTNEIQTLSIEGTTLSISKGNSVDLDNSSTKNVISIPAFSMIKSPSSTIIKETNLGLQWTRSSEESAIVVVKKPNNYNGGDVTFSIFYRATVSTAGIVQFVIKPNSYNSADELSDVESITDNGVKIVGKTGVGPLYEQKITIPADRLSGDWWYISIERNGSSSSYHASVIVLSVALTY